MKIPGLILTQKYQIALFPNRLLGQGTQNWNQIFTELVALEVFSNGQNLILPLSPDVPSNMPRVILKSSDEKISCVITGEKIEIFFINPTDETDFSLSVEDRISQMNQIINAIDPKLNFKRVGSIHNFYFLTDSSDPVKEEVLQNNAVQNLFDYGIRLTYLYSVMETQCNYVLDLTHGTHVTTNKNIPVIQADFNTSQDVSINWNLAQAGNFVEEAEAFLLKEFIVRKLFPLQEERS